jgi:hypothetical protein
MLVDETADGTGAAGDPSDQQVDDFYQSLAREFTVTTYDLASEQRIGLAEMGAYSTIVWYGDDQIDAAAAFAAREELQDYLMMGGKFLYTGYRPSRAFTGINVTSGTYGPGDYMFDVFGIGSSELRVFSRFSGAVPIVGPEASYPAVRVDSLKAGSASAYHLRQIENIYAVPGVTDVYSYDSGYDSSSSFGGSKGKPVGVQMRNQTYRSVVLGFPLYFMRQDDARALLHHILTEVFSQVTGEGEPAGAVPSGFALEQNYPNPFNPSTSIRFQVPENGWVTLAVYDVLGREVAVLVDGPKAPGSYLVRFDAGGLASGVYLSRLTCGSFIQTRKMLLMQ